MGKLATNLDDFLPSSSSVPCSVEDQKVSPAMSSVSRGGLSEFIWPSVAVLAFYIKVILFSCCFPCQLLPYPLPGRAHSSQKQERKIQREREKEREKNLFGVQVFRITQVLQPLVLSVISRSVLLELQFLLGDQKYFEVLGSTIEEHRPCPFLVIYDRGCHRRPVHSKPKGPATDKLMLMPTEAPKVSPSVFAPTKENYFRPRAP
ncbi:hypothetical protein DY000_02047944 [Brassica cretica]|uniref:Uncharacterized protein n=1 Tax=Brassica cretica TaxID=69181 RepID=A0ABQ7F5Y7_BRACR|nr:hypothetical protein DY000_02047944 [Brassica cretica]